MNNKLKARVELFARNSGEIRRSYRMQFAQTKRLAALAYALEDRAIDSGALRASYELIKRRVGPFSMFRGSMAVGVAAAMALSKDPPQLLEEALAAYGGLKATGFYASDFLVIAAQQIAMRHGGTQQGEAAARARELYIGLKRLHPLLTGTDDQIYCAMLALSDIDIQRAVDRIARLYGELKPDYRWACGVQTLAEVLVLGGEDGGAIDRLPRLRDAFRARDVRMDGPLTLSSLGVLALLPVDPLLAVDEMMDVCELLRERDGFGRWSVMNRELLVIATALVASGQVDEAKRGLSPALSASVARLALAQQAALAAAAASSAAMAAAASSGS